MREQELCMPWTGSAEEEKTNLLLYKMYRASSQNITFGCGCILNLHSVPHIRPQTKVMICFLFRKVVLKNSKWFSYFRINRCYSHYNPFSRVSLMAKEMCCESGRLSCLLNIRVKKYCSGFLNSFKPVSRGLSSKELFLISSSLWWWMMTTVHWTPLVGSTLHFWIFPAIHSDKNCVFILLRGRKENI